MNIQFRKKLIFTEKFCFLSWNNKYLHTLQGAKKWFRRTEHLTEKTWSWFIYHIVPQLLGHLSEFTRIQMKSFLLSQSRLPTDIQAAHRQSYQVMHLIAKFQAGRVSRDDPYPFLSLNISITLIFFFGVTCIAVGLFCRCYIIIILDL